LQSIVGYTDLLIAGECQQNARGDLEEIRFAAHRAAKIVQNLLAFVRRSSAERTTESLNAIVLRTIALRQYELATTGFVLEETYGEDLPPVQVNREEISRSSHIVPTPAGVRAPAATASCRHAPCARERPTGSRSQDDGPGAPRRSPDGSRTVLHD
jgi:hypothetical protein